MPTDKPKHKNMFWRSLNNSKLFANLFRATKIYMYYIDNVLPKRRKYIFREKNLVGPHFPFFYAPFPKRTPAGIRVLALRVERGRESSDKFKSLCLFKPWQSQTNWHNRPCKVKIFFVCLSVGDTNPVSKRLWPFKRKMWAKSINKFSF